VHQEFSADKKSRSHRLVAAAIADGVLVRGPCELCGAVPTEGHHEDYDLPLEVRWLCKVHHSLRHVEIQSARPPVSRRTVSVRELREVATQLDEPVWIVSSAENGFRRKLALWVPMWLVDEEAGQ